MIANRFDRRLVQALLGLLLLDLLLPAVLICLQEEVPAPVARPAPAAAVQAADR